jgi:L-seryl-tRNA(Ser) seleniumtransferase
MDRLLRDPQVQPLVARWGRLLVKRALDDALSAHRSGISGHAGAARADGIAAADPGAASGATANTPAGAAAAKASTVTALVATAGAALAARFGAPVVPAINLTGTLLHTNLGRATLPAVAAEAMRAAAGPVLLEFDPRSGRRGRREAHVEGLLEALTGAEAATVVNNNAAALLLVLNELALGRTVPVSRGELIEIGGSFRLPELMLRAGCRLREVGTTNRTHAHDFERAIDADTALLLKVFPSNFAIQGFTSEVAMATLAGIAHARGLPLVVDLGSGSLVDVARYGLPAEPHPREVLAAGADLVTFSGDKLLGGPQMGLVVGRRDLVQALDRNPLKRALRVDKARLAAMTAVLRLHADAPEALADALPLLRQLGTSTGELERRAHALRARIADHYLPHFRVDVVATRAQVGSGALPTTEVESRALRFTAADPSRPGRVAALARALREGEPAIIGRVHDDALLLDLRAADAGEPLAELLLGVDVDAVP